VAFVFGRSKQLNTGKLVKKEKGQNNDHTLNTWYINSSTSKVSTSTFDNRRMKKAGSWSRMSGHDESGGKEIHCRRVGFQEDIPNRICGPVGEPIDELEIIRMI
jgi:hypothetical protein